MKKTALSFFIFALFGFLSCKQEDVNVIEDLTELATADSSAVAAGSFMNDAHPTSGKAEVFVQADGSKELIFSDFKTDPGPNLLVYLASDTKAADAINLGKLKGTSGQFSYTLPDQIDLNNTNYVLIWCVDFSVNFGYAKLE